MSINKKKLKFALIISQNEKSCLLHELFGRFEINSAIKW